MSLNRSQDCAQDSALYPVTITQSTSNRVKIHYIGYSSRYDEWRTISDLIHLESPVYISEDYGFTQDLALKIKSSLSSQRKANPAVRIEMMYDKRTFDEGLRMKGKFKQQIRGVEHYTIDAYSDLDSLLGCNWHYRGLNSAGDFCYVLPGTVDFYLCRRRPLIHYTEKEKNLSKLVFHGDIF